MSITRFSTGFMGDTALAGNTSFSASDFELISTIRVGSAGASSITFSNIPQEYKHLQLRSIGRGTNAYQFGAVYLNNDTTSTNYKRHWLYGGGTSATSENGSDANSLYFPDSGRTASVFGAAVVDILDYSNASKYKTFRTITGYDSSTFGLIGLVSNLWINISATTSVTATIVNGSFAQYSKFSLYGIRG